MPDSVIRSWGDWSGNIYLRKELDAEKKEMQTQIERYELKVIGDQSDEDAYQYLTIDNCSSYITKIGSVHISVLAHINSSCNVYGNPNAHVDGTLAGQVFQEGRLIGVADLVSTLEGISFNETTLKGIALCNADPDKKCEIVISPKNLWAMEN